MFRMTLLDHIRLTFGQVVHRHRAHEQLAEQLARQLSLGQAFELSLLAVTLAATVTAALAQAPPFTLIAAGLATLALIVRALAVARRLESRMYAHRWCGARLWLIREKYYALLSELADDLIDVDEARERRDDLMSQLHAVYHHAPMVDRPAYQSAREALEAGTDASLSEEELDRFLPASARRAAGETGAWPAAAPDAGEERTAH